jgi:acyl-CoA thioesterase FadM
MDFVCTNLENGRPVRMPEIFKERYVVDSEKV